MIQTFVDQQFGGQCKTLLFPEFGVVYTRTDNLFNQILRICSVYVLRIFHRAVGHIYTRFARVNKLKLQTKMIAIQTSIFQRSF